MIYQKKKSLTFYVGVRTKIGFSVLKQSVIYEKRLVYSKSNRFPHRGNLQSNRTFSTFDLKQTKKKKKKRNPLGTHSIYIGRRNIY